MNNLRGTRKPEYHKHLDFLTSESFMSYSRNPRTVRERMPETVVKIIGSKYVRFPAKKFKEQKDAEGNVQKILGGVQDPESFRQSLLSRDRSSCGLLPVVEFQAVCASHGAPLTFSSMTPLLEDKDFSDQGNIRWKQIVDLLQETEKEKSAEQTVGVTQENAICEEEGSVYGGTSERESIENSPVACRRSAALQDARPRSEPALHLCETLRSGNEELTWIDRFMKMENVLELCQIKDTGLVEAERAKQIISKYNLIYTLCLSPEKICDALEKSRRGAHIVLEPALRFLKEL